MSPEVWARCAPWIEAAIQESSGTHNLDDVRELVEAGEAQLWAGRRCALVTDISEFPRLKLMTLWLAGGDLVELIGMLPAVEAFAKAKGCQKIGVSGRPGWVRVLKTFGYAPQGRSSMKGL